MKYVALLRGINVGGNSLIKMSELKFAFEQSGCMNVLTYINSGNVIFESDKKGEKLTEILEKDLPKTFDMNLRLVILSEKEMEEVIANIPDEWKKEIDLRKYVAFVKDPVQPNEAIKEFDIKEGIDSVKEGKHVIYMSTKLEGITKSKFSKLAGKKIYKDITIRNFNTVEKITGIIQKN
jgi:uncharacterized protein (DUF1697 family)